MDFWDVVFMWLGFRAPSATMSAGGTGTYARLLRGDQHADLGVFQGKELEVRGRMTGGMRVSVVG